MTSFWSPLGRVRLITFVTCLAAAASLVFWGLRALGYAPLQPAPATTIAPAAAPVPIQAAETAEQFARMGLLLGVQAANTPVPSDASRFQLMGVAFAGSQQGAALIGMEGKPAKHFRVGQTVDGDLRLMSLGSRQAMLGVQNGKAKQEAFTLELPLKK